MSILTKFYEKEAIITKTKNYSFHDIELMRKEYEGCYDSLKKLGKVCMLGK